MDRKTSYRGTDLTGERRLSGSGSDEAVEKRSTVGVRIKRTQS